MKASATLNRLAPFWQGHRAEDILTARLAAREREAAARPPRTHHVSDASPQRRLRRLKRALTRRKTEAARARIRKEIRQLESA